jgi:holo-[acyl-carrier protein] synthase
MIRGIGIDIVEARRMARAYERHGPRLVRRICRPEEGAALGGDVVRRLSEAFAVKEAVMKALGTGQKGVSWQEILALGRPSGSVDDLLYGRALERARVMGISTFALSTAWSEELVLAAAILQD